MKKNFAVIFILILLFAWQQLTRAQGETDFVLDWTAYTYTPPGYQGKPLPTTGSLIKVTAMPTQKLSANPALFKYNWFLDEKIVSASSGIGKTEFTFRAQKSAGGIHAARVRISDEKGIFIVQKVVPIRLASPEIGIYRQINGSLMFNQFNASQTLAAGQEIALAALPFFFNISELNELNFRWQFGDQIFEGNAQKNPNQFVLRIGKITKDIKDVLNVRTAKKETSGETASQQINLLIETPF